MATSEKDVDLALVHRASVLQRLAPEVAAEQLDAFALRSLAAPYATGDTTLADALWLLARPWSNAVARAYLDGLRTFAAALAPDATTASPWDATLETAALAMPEALFAEAREPVAAPESKRWQIAQFGKQLDAFAETVRLRERLVKVLPL